MCTTETVDVSWFQHVRTFYTAIENSFSGIDSAFLRNSTLKWNGNFGLNGFYYLKGVDFESIRNLS